MEGKATVVPSAVNGREPGKLASFVHFCTTKQFLCFCIRVKLTFQEKSPVCITLRRILIRLGGIRTPLQRGRYLYMYTSINLMKKRQSKRTISTVPFPLI